MHGRGSSSVAVEDDGKIWTQLELISQHQSSRKGRIGWFVYLRTLNSKGHSQRRGLFVLIVIDHMAEQEIFQFFSPLPRGRIRYFNAIVSV